MMKAILLKDFGGPEQLVLREIPVPQVGPDDVLVRVESAGICHHDLLHRAGKLPGAPAGVILGHEVSGEIVQTGSSVTALTAGDRVVGYQRRFCGTCRDCLRGRQDLCRSLSLPAINTEVAYAEYIRLPAISDIRLPDNVTYPEDALAYGPISRTLRALFYPAVIQDG